LSSKKRSAERAGCVFEETSSWSHLLEGDAALIQLPVPPEAVSLLEKIPLGKDADVLSKAAREKFGRGDADSLLPPVVSAIQKILEFGKVEIVGKRVVVVGAGFLVGAPTATWLKQKGAHVEVVTLESGDLSALLRAADIVVSGAGSPHLIKPGMLKEGVVLIDAGTSEASGKIVGDADPACASKCLLFTPVPGGLGPLAVACLFENVVTLAERTNSSILAK
jgi:methylenetetrahydrofolate dehydrogenase (NADP+)/methenyltetrahydrofolate cyclohydrolase